MGSKARLESANEAPSPKRRASMRSRGVIRAISKERATAAPRSPRAFGLRVRGSRAWLWANAPHQPPTALGLASALAEHEAAAAGARKGSAPARVETLTLCVRDRSDAGWLRAIIEWLEGHDYGIVLRTRVRLPRELALWLRGRPVAIELELASLDARVQRALLGPGAAAANELLLQAQHFAVLGLELGARLGPLLPGVHELPDFEALLAATRAADVHDVDLQLGRLGPQCLERLTQVLDAGPLMLLLRAMRLAPTAAFDLDFEARELPRELGASLLAGFAAVVRDQPGSNLRCMAARPVGRRRVRAGTPAGPSLQTSLFGEQHAG